MPGGYEGWNQTRITAQGDGAALGNTTTATSILPAQAKLIVPAHTFGYIGKLLRVRAFGRVSNIVTAPGTLTLDIRFGGTIVANGGAMTLNVVAKTNVTWRLDWDLVCRSAPGTACALMHTGEWKSESVIGSAAGQATISSLPASAPAVGTTFDSTAQQAFDMFAAWQTANAGNTITLHHLEIVDAN